MYYISPMFTVISELRFGDQRFRFRPSIRDLHFMICISYRKVLHYYFHPTFPICINMTSHPQRVAAAEAMFKQIIRDALGSIVEPSRDRTRPLLQYADVLAWEMVSQWMDEEGWKAPIWFDDNTKEIIFIKLHRIHHILKGTFDCEVLMQFYNRGDTSQKS